MKPQQIKKDFILFILLLFVAFTIPLPLHSHLTGYAIISLGIGWIYYGEWKNKWNTLRRNPYFFLFLGFYLLMVVGTFYSTDKNSAKFLLEKNLSILVLPLIIFSTPIISENRLRVIVKTFIASCFLISAADLINAGIQPGENNFDFEKLAAFLDVHHSYFAMYLSFSVLFITIDTYYSFKNLSRINIIFRLLFCIYFIMFIYLIAARMGMGALFINLILLLLIYFYKKKELFKGITVLLIGCVILCAVVISLPNMRKRFDNLFFQNREWIGHNTKNEWLTRGVHWGCYLEAISENNLLWGAGSGDSFINVAYCYKRWEYYGYYEKWNAHNQYLEILLRWGILGITIWMCCLLFPFWISIKRKNIYYGVFIFLFGLSCLTETMLDRQHGVVFYSFFNTVFASCFLFQSKEKEIFTVIP